MATKAKATGSVGGKKVTGITKAKMNSAAGNAMKAMRSTGRR